MIDNHEEMRFIAEKIALEAGAVKKCPYHEDVILEVDDLDANEKAYKKAAYMFKRGDYPVFSSQRELTDEIKEIIDTASGSCYSCDRF
ncbi:MULTISPECIES: hypothetical protein [Vibrio]|uniref:hypothetical protein n=1 Tax=Vibrio TaxID=662 RepID=UPI00101F2E35|nr:MULTISPECIES: hypothetical protein [Vibrio]MCC2524545.1 hypothetical protein [Vibrio coralliilyticus]NGZ68735.1 hypothetical protein [Vibrio aestuarianus subsp. cardii]